MSLPRKIINFLVSISEYAPCRIWGASGNMIHERYAPFWPDEYVDDDGRVHHKLPWYRPLNILLNHWVASDDEKMHDHPRWTITIVLYGVLMERTPWRLKILRPGSVVFRSHKYMHSIEIPEGSEAWTLFIVGGRKHRQNLYRVFPQSLSSLGKFTANEQLSSTTRTGD